MESDMRVAPKSLLTIIHLPNEQAFQRFFVGIVRLIIDLRPRLELGQELRIVNYLLQNHVAPQRLVCRRRHNGRQREEENGRTEHHHLQRKQGDDRKWANLPEADTSAALAGGILLSYSST